MPEYFRYFLNLLVWAVALMTGILSMFREILAIFRPDRVPPRSLFWNCVVIAFILSAGILWYLEHLKVCGLSLDLEKERERNTPNLIGRIDTAFSGFSPDINATQVFVVVSLRNSGAPSVAEEFTLSVENSKIALLKLWPTYIKDGYRLFGEKEEVIAEFSRDITLEDKASNPIPQGGVTRGWLRFVLKGTKVEDVQRKDTRYTIHFKDYLGKSYSISTKRAPQDHPRLTYLPGAGSPIKKVPQEE